MHLKYLQISLAFLALRSIRCDSYCDDIVRICLYHNSSDFVHSWEDAQNHCSRNGSILLEIYDKQYEDVTLKALQKFNLNGWYLLLGLESINGQFRWLTTGREAHVETHDNRILNRSYKAFLIWDGPKLRTEFSDGILGDSHRFICLKELDDNMRQSHDQQESNNTAIGVGIGVTLSIIIISLAILIIFIVKQRLNAKNRRETSVKGSTPPPTNPSNDASIVYADLQFKETTSDHRTENSNAIYENSNK